MQQEFASVWHAIEDPPEEAEHMRLRSSLMMSLQNHINKKDLTQAQAAALFGVMQPRVVDLVRGNINVFGIESLIHITTRAGFTVKINAKTARKV
jgi:predicted XRE-type DNA-binding protein